jgi:hypothetical protein
MFHCGVRPDSFFLWWCDAGVSIFHGGVRPESVFFMVVLAKDDVFFEADMLCPANLRRLLKRHYSYY